MALLKVSCPVIIPVLFIIATYLQTGSAIMCYECNSHNDSRCADEKLPENLKKDCSEHMKGVQYTMCRKIVQNIDFEVNGNKPDNRVIRGCGFDESNYKGRCYQRSGFGGRQEVCSCLTDFCNGAPPLLGPLSTLLLGSAAALALFAALY